MVDHNTENISERKQVLIIKLEWEKGKKKPQKNPKPGLSISWIISAYTHSSVTVAEAVGSQALKYSRI